MRKRYNKIDKGIGRRFCGFAKKPLSVVLGRMEVLVLPLILMLVLLLASVLVWRLVQSSPEQKELLPIKVWEQKKAGNLPDTVDLLSGIFSSPSSYSFETELSKNDFWFFLDVPKNQEGKDFFSPCFRFGMLGPSVTGSAGRSEPLKNQQWLCSQPRGIRIGIQATARCISVALPEQFSRSCKNICGFVATRSACGSAEIL